MGSAVAFMGPMAASYLMPVNIPGHRFYKLTTKSEEYQIEYRSVYERVTRMQRLKYSLSGTGYSTVVLGVTAAIALVGFIGLMGHLRGFVCRLKYEKFV